MKSVSKVLFIATMVVYSLTAPMLAMEGEDLGITSASPAVKGTRAANGFVYLARHVPTGIYAAAKYRGLGLS